ncbi:alpha-ketoglutarate-dependent dioxygenase alkB homolog 3-like [Centruroides vittatus]|uniref:alpha-ketoglutarate-dependent dioxygenase alkB homolog 3-like n=1 Tax=Centruroides vittatus TaxID=120091 RepID=UPI00350F1736
MCQENLEKRDKSLKYGNDLSYNMREVTLADNSKAMESATFTKNLFMYEPTKLEETVKEKKTKRISDPRWHTLSTEPSGRSEIYFKQDFINEVYEKAYFNHLNKYIKWELKEVWNSRGIKYPQPRMVAWFGPFPYSYSGMILKANKKFPEIALEIKNKIEDLLKLQGRTVTFNSVLLNKYRDGKDGVAWHSDSKLSMGVDPLIASVSLGETRKFEMKKRSEEPNKDSADNVIYLESGSLLLMDGVMQQDWLHRVPKEYHDKSTRINLTF